MIDLVARLVGDLVPGWRSDAMEFDLGTQVGIRVSRGEGTETRSFAVRGAMPKNEEEAQILAAKMAEGLRARIKEYA